MMVDMQFVASSSIESVGYDPDYMELHVRYLTNPAITYVYLGVPQDVYDQLLTAPSVGSFVNREIKDVYPFDRR